MFYHLFKKENDIEENIIRFRLWEIDGLQTRLNFSRDNPSPELVDRLKADEKYIESIKTIVEQFSYFKRLNEKRKKYLIKYAAWKFSSHSLVKPEQKQWQHTIKELIDRTGIRQNILSDMYSYYSMHAHTGYISILQNDDLPNKEKMMAKWVAIMNASFVTSCMIKDLSKMFAEGVAFYQTLTKKEIEELNSFKIKD